MTSIKIISTAVFLVLTTTLCAQESKKFKIHTVAFYNLENLFDTINDPTKFDEASPIMEMSNGRSEVYKKKVHNMARVIADIGADKAQNSPAIVGVAEIENRAVLADVINDSLLVEKDYGIVHFDSPDNRGIDVGLIYQKALFQPINTSSHTVYIYDKITRKRVYTRDQLLVSGHLDGDLMHIIVNHWPSRSGGEQRSRNNRIGTAQVTKKIIDSLHILDPYAKIIIMGDFNDNPNNASIKNVLKAKANQEEIGLQDLYNPYESFHKQGLGSNAYRDAWSLFDQIMITHPFLDKDYSSFRFYKAFIFNKNHLTTKRGKWKGYPFRSFADGGFTGGFSDHFPVYIYLIKEVE